MAPVVAGMALVTDHIGYIIERMLIGWSLAAFVICQFWSSMMFSPNVVGTANSIVGGWGNAGAAPPLRPSMRAFPAGCVRSLGLQLLILREFNSCMLQRLPYERCQNVLIRGLTRTIAGPHTARGVYCHYPYCRAHWV